MYKYLSQPPGGRRLIQVIQVEISFCADTVIFIVLLIIPKALPVLTHNLIEDCSYIK